MVRSTPKTLLATLHCISHCTMDTSKRLVTLCLPVPTWMTRLRSSKQPWARRRERKRLNCWRRQLPRSVDSQTGFLRWQSYRSSFTAPCSCLCSLLFTSRKRRRQPVRAAVRRHPTHPMVYTTRPTNYTSLLRASVYFFFFFFLFLILQKQLYIVPSRRRS